MDTWDTWIASCTGAYWMAGPIVVLHFVGTLVHIWRGEHIAVVAVRIENRDQHCPVQQKWMAIAVGCLWGM